MCGLSPILTMVPAAAAAVTTVEVASAVDAVVAVVAVVAVIVMVATTGVAMEGLPLLLDKYQIGREVGDPERHQAIMGGLLMAANTGGIEQRISTIKENVSSTCKTPMRTAALTAMKRKPWRA
jgi:hypothetical protein